MPVDSLVRPRAAAPALEMPAQRDRVRRDWRGPLTLLFLQAGALSLQVIAVTIARRGAGDVANIVSFSAFGLTFFSALWMLTRRNLSRTMRNAAVLCLAVMPALQWHIGDPFPFASYDETLHMRALRQIEAAHRLFQPHPLLEVTSHYPGLESLTVLLYQCGLPETAAVTVVLLLARLALVLSLCAATEQVTGSIRGGGLAVAVYAVSPQFVMFNSQFSYQTLALPLALTAVALVARARTAAAWKPVMAAAGMCLVALSLTHHMTSVITAVFLLLWTVAQSDGRSRKMVLIAAGVSVLATSVWTIVQLPVLRDYFTPMIDQLSAQLFRRPKRALFSENSGHQNPMWEKALLVYFSAAVSSAVAWLVVVNWRRLLRRIRPSTVPSSQIVFPPRTTAFLLSITALIPILFAVRVMPRWGEFGDRASSFLYLPLSLLLAGEILRWFPDSTVSPRRGRARHTARSAIRSGISRSALLLLATGVFLGGYLLGSGASWSRLPGGYEPAAERRSMDVETLTAVRWARDALPPGSRIGADRLGSTLLSSEARLWAVHTYADGLDLPSLYQADHWGQAQTEMARRLQVRYLYVDSRFAQTPPRIGGYFDESGPGLHFTMDQLTKFRRTDGITEIYRHGPISIYDLDGLGVPTLLSGWTGKTPPPVATPVQVVVGLLIGAALGVFGSSHPGRRLGAVGYSLLDCAGPSLLLGTVLAGGSLLSIAMLVAGIWFGPTALLSIILGVSIAAMNVPQVLPEALRSRQSDRCSQ